jgi:hypothetical protein
MLTLFSNLNYGKSVSYIYRFSKTQLQTYSHVFLNFYIIHRKVLYIYCNSLQISIYQLLSFSNEIVSMFYMIFKFSDIFVLDKWNRSTWINIKSCSLQPYITLWYDSAEEKNIIQLVKCNKYNKTKPWHSCNTVHRCVNKIYSWWKVTNIITKPWHIEILFIDV